jgi:hypothetical protein
MPRDLRKTDGFSLIDFCVKVEDQEWHNYVDSVETEQVNSSQVTDADLVIPTVDTDRH